MTSRHLFLTEPSRIGYVSDQTVKNIRPSLPVASGYQQP
jgi:hypothetical protein